MQDLCGIYIKIYLYIEIWTMDFESWGIKKNIQLRNNIASIFYLSFLSLLHMFMWGRGMRDKGRKGPTGFSLFGHE